MKKFLVVLIAILILSGCSNIQSKDYDTLINEAASSKYDIVNTYRTGYKYYAPGNMDISNILDYNETLEDSSHKYYFYVDVVSYYYHNNLNFNEEDSVDSYYYHKINNSGKVGYIKIAEEKDDIYFIKIVYNYAKVETYVPKTKIDTILANSMIILDSIDYNDNLIKKILDDEYFSSVDKEYKIKKPEDAKSKFSEYLSEYVQDEESVIPDLPEY